MGKNKRSFQITSFASEKINWELTIFFENGNSRTEPIPFELASQYNLTPLRSKTITHIVYGKCLFTTYELEVSK
jgi:hypothetical protein